MDHDLTVSCRRTWQCAADLQADGRCAHAADVRVSSRMPNGAEGPMARRRTTTPRARGVGVDGWARHDGALALRPCEVAALTPGVGQPPPLHEQPVTPRRFTRRGAVILPAPAAHRDLIADGRGEGPGGAAGPEEAAELGTRSDPARRRLQQLVRPPGLPTGVRQARRSAGTTGRLGKHLAGVAQPPTAVVRLDHVAETRSHHRRLRAGRTQRHRPCCGGAATRCPTHIALSFGRASPSVRRRRRR